MKNKKYRKRLFVIIMALIMMTSFIPLTPAYGASGDAAEIEETGVCYQTLSEAFTAANAGDTVKLLEDINVGSDTVVIGKKLTFDLNGHTLKSDGATALRLEHLDDVTIKDSSASGTGKIKGGTSEVSAVVVHLGSLTLESGTIEGGHGGIGLMSSAKVYINGGTVSGDAFGISTQNGSNLVVTDGTITQTGINAARGAVYLEGGEATITGGNLSGGSAVYARYGGKITIEGKPVMTGTNSTSRPGVLFAPSGATAKFYVNGGYYNTDHFYDIDNIIIGKGMDFVPADGQGEPSGYYKIVMVALVHNVTLDEYYDSMDAAIAGISENDGTQILELVNDIDVSGTAVNVNKNFIFDLNGHEITGNGYETILVDPEGVMTVKDSSTDSSGKITNTDGGGVGVRNQGKLTVKSGVIESAGVGIHNDQEESASPETNVSGGTVSGDAAGIANDEGGTVTIDDGVISSSDGLSVVNFNGEFFINGGKYSDDEGNKSSYIRKDGLILFDYDDDGWFTLDTPPVAKRVAGGKDIFYPSLQAAVDDALDSGDKVYLIKDVALSERLDILNKDITLNLGSYTLSDADDFDHDSGYGQLINVEAEKGKSAGLKLTGEEDGKIEHSGSYAVYLRNTSNASGTNSKFVMDTVTVSAGKTAICAIGNHIPVTIDSGAVHSDEDAAASGTIHGTIFGGNSTITINGGTVTSRDGSAVSTGITGKAVIKDGTISGGTYAICDGGTNNSSITIDGGVFTGGEKTIYKMTGATFIIKGGAFSDDAGNGSGFTRAGGKYLVKDEAPGHPGYYGLADAVAQNVTADECYMSLTEAITEAETGDIVKLLKDTEENVTVSKSLTLDLNGKELSSGGETVVVTGGATLTLTGENGTVVSTGTNTRAIRITNAALVIDGANVVSSCTGVYINDGSVTLKSGTVEATGNRPAIHTDVSLMSDATASFTMSGGTVKNTCATGTQLGAVRVNGKGESAISGGSVSTTGGSGSAVIVSKGQLTVSGETTKITSGGSGAALTSGGINDETGSITVNGGVIENRGDGPSVAIGESGSAFMINGGYYSDDEGNRDGFTRAANHELAEVTEGEHAYYFALSHNWGDPAYEWSSDNSKVTATRVCESDGCGKSESETVAATGKVTKQPTAAEKGEIEYTSAAFENKAFEIQTKTEAIPAKGYAPGEDPDQKGDDGTAVGPGASAASADKKITSLAADKDPKGAKYLPLKLRSTKQTKTSVTIKWTKVSKAKKYVIYGNKCGKSNKPKKLATVTGSSKAFSKVAGKKVAKGKAYKFIVVALDKDNNVVSTSTMIHAFTKGGKYTNHKAVKVRAKVKGKYKVVKAVSVKKGKSKQLKAKGVKYAAKKKYQKHIGMRFESSKKAVATVSSKGVIKGKKKGTCYVYAYSQNGIAKKIKVTVK